MQEIRIWNAIKLSITVGVCRRLSTLFPSLPTPHTLFHHNSKGFAKAHGSDYEIITSSLSVSTRLFFESKDDMKRSCSNSQKADSMEFIFSLQAHEKALFNRYNAYKLHTNYNNNNTTDVFVLALVLYRTGLRGGYVPGAQGYQGAHKEQYWGLVPTVCRLKMLR